MQLDAIASNTDTNRKKEINIVIVTDGVTEQDRRNRGTYGVASLSVETVEKPKDRKILPVQDNFSDFSVARLRIKRCIDCKKVKKSVRSRIKP